MREGLSPPGRPGIVGLRLRRSVVANKASSSSSVASLDQQSFLPTDLIEVGYVMGAYGVGGWLKVQPHSRSADALLSVKQWWLAPASTGAFKRDVAAPKPIVLLAAKNHSGTIVAQVRDLTCRDAAQSLKGHSIWVSRSQFPAAAKDEYYWVDLIGLTALTVQGQLLGEVVGLLDNAAHPILRITYAEGDASCGASVIRERLIPFVEAIVSDVDLNKKQIHLNWELDY
ncbi:MAG: ribosome maturation factor RimM [Ottowia sp.]|nr:ribosome maturation factor RimM [Ottowia sp.]